MRILLVEDEEPIAQVIRDGLESAYFGVDIAPDGQSGLKLAREGNYSLMVLDIMLPKLDGWTVCEALRTRRSRLPILMLTACDGVDDRVRGLDLGADDYLTKPFEFRELLARVRALLRREKMHKSRVIRIADLDIDTGLRHVRRAGRTIHLTPREYALLEALAVREGAVVSRELIQEQVWMDEETCSNMVDVYIGQLRKKVDAGHSVKLIRTIHCLGYMLQGPDSSAQT